VRRKLNLHAKYFWPCGRTGTPARIELSLDAAIAKINAWIVEVDKA
jgi:hypothetical protein